MLTVLCFQWESSVLFPLSVKFEYLVTHSYQFFNHRWELSIHSCIIVDERCEHFVWLNLFNPSIAICSILWESPYLLIMGIRFHCSADYVILIDLKHLICHWFMLANAFSDQWFSDRRDELIIRCLLILIRGEAQPKKKKKTGAFTNLNLDGLEWIGMGIIIQWCLLIGNWMDLNGLK